MGRGREQRVPESTGYVLTVLSMTLVTFHPMLVTRSLDLATSPGWRQGLGHLPPTHSPHLAHPGAQEMFD